MGFDLNLVCIGFSSLFEFVVLTRWLGFFVLHGWMSHNGSSKVKMGAVELVATKHGHGHGELRQLMMVAI